MYVCMHVCVTRVCVCFVCRYTLYALRVLLHTRLGVSVSRSWLSRMLSRWRWSFKNLNHKHVHKFTAHNIAYYGQYLTHIRNIPMTHIKFLDEASFSSRGNTDHTHTHTHTHTHNNITYMHVSTCHSYACVCVHVCVCVVELVRRRGVSARGARCHVVSAYSLSETIKVSVLTSLFCHVSPFHVDMRSGDRANDQYDHLLVITRFIEEALLVRGDVLVLDNASIHRGDEILLPLQLLLDAAGIRMWFLPTYSPELNPCELVFAQCKKYLRYHRRMQHPFWYEIARGFANTTHMHMLNYYITAIWKP